MKILMAEISHETNTFSCKRTDFDRWCSFAFGEGEEILSKFENQGLMTSGMIRAAREHGAELIPTLLMSTSGPLVTREAVEETMRRFLPYVKQHKDEIDGVCLSLHGAACAEGIDDLDGYILEQVRREVGELPITVCADLHGNISPKMVTLSNGVFGEKEYPHVDMADTGYIAMDALIRQIQGEHMETAMAAIPMLVPCSRACTTELPMKEFTDFVKEYVQTHNLVDAAFFHGFPFSDVPDSRASIVVVAGEHAEEAAAEIAQYIWDNRRKLDVECLTPQQAIRRAEDILAQEGDGYVVINEASDNPGGGCPCDGTHLLRALIENDVPGSILAYIYDPEFARKAHAAGVAGRVSGTLGGKTEPIHGYPLDIENAYVCNLSDGKATLVTPMMPGFQIDMGKTARVRIGQVEVVVTEKLWDQPYDDRWFVMTGADVQQYRIVCLKSTNHFKGYFRPRAKGIVATDPPGIHTCDFAALDYKNLRRPVYPLDPDMEYVPNVCSNRRP